MNARPAIWSSVHSGGVSIACARVRILRVLWLIPLPMRTSTARPLAEAAHAAANANAAVLRSCNDGRWGERWGATDAPGRPRRDEPATPCDLPRRLTLSSGPKASLAPCAVLPGSVACRHPLARCPHAAASGGSAAPGRAPCRPSAQLAMLRSLERHYSAQHTGASTGSAIAAPSLHLAPATSLLTPGGLSRRAC